MDTVPLYLTVQQHRLISPSLAMAVGVEYSFLCCQAIICHDYSNSFNLFRLSFSSSVPCWGVMQTLWCTSANSRYVYKLINSVISLIPYPQKEKVEMVTLAQILCLAEALKACHCWCMNAKWFALRNVKLMTSHSMDNALAESYMDSSTPPSYSIVLRFCSNCVKSLQYDMHRY